MAFNPGKDRNMMASLKRTMDSAWFGNNVSGRSQAPDVLSGEYLLSVNAAANGTVGLVGADVNNQIVFPMQASIPLSAAQIQTLNTAPVPLIAAPPAGFAIILEQLVLELNLVAPAFTGGGPVFAVHTGQTAQLTASIAASVLQGAPGQYVYAANSVSGAGGANSMQVLPNTGINLYAATANFAAGAGTGKVFLAYSLLSL